MLNRLGQVYSKIYRLLPIPARRCCRAVFHFLGGGTPDQEAVNSVASFYRSIGIIGAGDLVFDIGANIGVYSSAFVSLGARVVAAEPDPSCAEMLRKRFKGTEGVTVLQKGLGERECTMELHLSGSRVSSTFSESFKRAEVRDFKTDYVGSVQVQVTTLDSMIKQYGLPKYCKIDVEGVELQVLKGLSCKVPYISFEFHSSMLSEAEACLELLEKKGYLFSYGGKPLAAWMPAKKIVAMIQMQSGKDGAIGGHGISGDVFAKLH